MTVKDVSTNVLLAVLTACPIALTGLAIRRAIVTDPPTRKLALEVTNWERIAAVGNRLGKGDGSITIVEFSDFQCPYCAQLQPTLRELRARHPAHVRLVFRHLPLSRIHRQAVAAAEASECASEQGAFERYHDVLFQHQSEIDDQHWLDFARQAGLADLEKFSQCLLAGRYVERVERDMALATTLGIHSTPTLIINGRLVRGNVPLAELDQDVRDMENPRHRWLSWLSD